MLLLLVSHTMYRNLHKYIIDLLTSYMIQYSSGYDPRFPRKQLWFEFQLGDDLLFIFFVVFCLLLLFSLVDLFFCFTFNRTGNPPTSAFRYKITKGSRYFYCVQKFSLFMSSHSSCLYNRAIFDPTNEVKCSKNFTGYKLHFS